MSLNTKISPASTQIATIPSSADRDNNSRHISFSISEDHDINSLRNSLPSSADRHISFGPQITTTASNPADYSTRGSLQSNSPSEFASRDNPSPQLQVPSITASLPDLSVATAPSSPPIDSSNQQQGRPSGDKVRRLEHP